MSSVAPLPIQWSEGGYHSSAITRLSRFHEAQRARSITRLTIVGLNATAWLLCQRCAPQSRPLAERVFKRMGYEVKRADVEAIVACKPGVIETVLMQLKQKVRTRTATTSRDRGWGYPTFADFTVSPAIQRLTSSAAHCNYTYTSHRRWPIIERTRRRHPIRPAMPAPRACHAAVARVTRGRRVAPLGGATSTSVIHATTYRALQPLPMPNLRLHRTHLHRRRPTGRVWQRSVMSSAKPWRYSSSRSASLSNSYA